MASPRQLPVWSFPWLLPALKAPPSSGPGSPIPGRACWELRPKGSRPCGGGRRGQPPTGLKGLAVHFLRCVSIRQMAASSPSQLPALKSSPPGVHPEVSVRPDLHSADHDHAQAPPLARVLPFDLGIPRTDEERQMGFLTLRAYPQQPGPSLLPTSSLQLPISHPTSLHMASHAAATRAGRTSCWPAAPGCQRPSVTATLPASAAAWRSLPLTEAPRPCLTLRGREQSDSARLLHNLLRPLQPHPDPSTPVSSATRRVIRLRLRAALAVLAA